MKTNAMKEVKNTSVEISFETVKKIMESSIDKKKLDKFFNESLSKTKEALKKSII